MFDALLILVILGALAPFFFILALRSQVGAARGLPTERPAAVGSGGASWKHWLVSGAVTTLGATINALYGYQGVLIAMVPLAVVAGVAYYGIGRREHSRRLQIQINRDQSAREIEERPDSTFWLYLRPFQTTGRMPAHDPWSNPLDSALAPSASGYLDLETILAEACQTPVIGLGHPGEFIGAGRIATPDSDWVQRFEALANRAQGFLVVPGASPGTAFELQHLRQKKRLDKTVFIMPPEVHGAPRWRAPVQAPLWDEAILTGRSIGLTFPPYAPDGAIFVLSNTGTLLWMESIHLHNPSALAEQVERVAKAAQSGTPAQASEWWTQPLDNALLSPYQEYQGPRNLTLPLLSVLGGGFATLFFGLLAVSQFEKASFWRTHFSDNEPLQDLASTYTNRGLLTSLLAGAGIWLFLRGMKNLR